MKPTLLSLISFFLITTSCRHEQFNVPKTINEDLNLNKKLEGTYAGEVRVSRRSRYLDNTTHQYVNIDWDTTYPYTMRVIAVDTHLLACGLDTFHADPWTADNYSYTYHYIRSYARYGFNEDTMLYEVWDFRGPGDVFSSYSFDFKGVKQ